MEGPIPEEAELANDLGNADPNANWGVEPNFNLNLTLTAPSNPRPAADTSKPHGAKNKDDGNKGGGAKGASVPTTPVTSPGESNDPWRLKSKIPTVSLSPTTEAPVNSRGEQWLKSPSPKLTSTLGTKTHGNATASPKPRRVEQTTAAGPGVKPQVQEPAGVSNPKPHGAPTPGPTTKTTNKMAVCPKVPTHRKDVGLDTESPKTLHLPVSLNVHNPKGDARVISPKLANRTSTTSTKTPKQDPGSTRQDSRTPSSDTAPKSPNQRAEAALLSAKTPRTSSLSPKPSTQRTASATRTRNASGSKEKLNSKDSSAASGSKTSSKSSSSSKAVDSLDSKNGSAFKVGSNSKTPMGSKDSLDSKGGSGSKTSWGSKDSLDSKTGSNSKAGCNWKSGLGSGDSLDSKTDNEIKPSKSSPDFKTVVGSKSGMGSKDNLDPKTQSPLDSKYSLSLKPPSELNLGSNSGFLSSSKPSLLDSGSNKDIVGSVSPSSPRTGLSGSKVNHLKAAGSSAKLSPEPKGSDSTKPGPIRSNSKSALANSSPSLTLSHRPGPAGRSPGSGTGKPLGSSPAGPHREVARSPSSAPGMTSGLPAALAGSSPKTRTTVAVTMTSTASVAADTNTSGTSHNTSPTRHLACDPTAETLAKTAVADEKEERPRPPETQVIAVRGLAICQGRERGADVTDNARQLPGDKRIPRASQGIPSHLGNANATAKGEQEEKKKKGGGGCSSSSLPLSSKTVRETATMTDAAVSPLLLRQRKEWREVGVQVESEAVEGLAVEGSAVEGSASFRSPIGSPVCQLATSPPPFQHVCKIDIELCRESSPTEGGADSRQSPGFMPGTRPTTHGILRSPAPTPEPRLGPNRDAGAETIWEEEEGEKGARPQEVAWDLQGRTWEVYGAAVDLECLGTAIQSHLESKIREQKKHIRTLRMSICSAGSPGEQRMMKKKRKEKRKGGILACCGRSPAVAD
ncbi:uncharacterized protein gprin3a isoform X2 [Clinocottus analis]|uniref:uncharacterized protein gprin3a isoform X2 n=1 Tax=Clinocottus analis TaxID=304258 RepID=UPI0035BFEFB1